MSSIANSIDDDNMSVPSLADAELTPSFGNRIVKPALRSLSQLYMKMTPGGATDQIRMNIIKAGNPKGIGVAEFLGIKVLSLGVFLVLGIVGQKFLTDDPLYKVALFFLFGLAGFSMPDTILQNVIKSRQTLIRKRLPDTIDLLIVSVEAGLGFDGAVAKVVDKVKGPISDEFRRVLDEMRLGKTRAKALKDMALRIDIPELTSFVAAIYQSEQLGVSIANVLRVQSETIRVARTQAIREAAAKLPVKMLFPLIFFIFPAIFLVLLGPAIISIKKVFN